MLRVVLAYLVLCVSLANPAAGAALVVVLVWRRSRRRAESALESARYRR